MAEEKQDGQENKAGTSDAKDSGTSSADDPRHSPSIQQQTQSDDPKERAAAAGLNAEGVNTEGDGGAAAMQEAQDKIDAKGFMGTVPDPTPNENYQAQNSTAENDLPTPETDAELYAKAQKASFGSPRENVESSSAETAVKGDQ